MKLTQQDKARLLGITPMTLRNWRKDKTYLYNIIMKGFAFEQMIEKSKQNYEDLLELEDSTKEIKKQKNNYTN